MDKRLFCLTWSWNKLKYYILFLLGVFLGLQLSQIWRTICNEGFQHLATISRPLTKQVHSTTTHRGLLQKANRNSSIVFVGGYPRSGTTLMRVLLDAHPDFYCGQETHIIPNLLTLQQKYSRGRALNRIKQAGFQSPDVINTTIAQTILNILLQRNTQSRRLCNKDPFTLKHIPYLSQMFPNAQFVLVVRDARAVLHSVHTSNVKITNFPKTDERALRRWSASVRLMLDGCIHVGPPRCLVVYYEKLVTNPRSSMKHILQFLHADWNESVLHHTQFLNTSDGIAVSSIEKSTHQVSKPIHQNSLYSWLSTSLNLPQDKLISLAPVMKTLGYTEIGQPPKYDRLNQTSSKIQADNMAPPNVL